MRTGMDFSSIHNVPRIGSYASAMRHWEKAKPWRGRDDNVRPLGDARRKFHNSVRKVGDDIVYRLYDTDVVTYHKDGSISVVPYHSKLTTSFADRLLPDGIRAYFNARIGCCIQVMGWFYLMNERSTLVLNRSYGSLSAWVISNLDEATMPFEKEIIDRKLSRKLLLATNYHEFAMWLTGMRIMAGIPSVGVLGGRPLWLADLMDYMADQPKGWMRMGNSSNSTHGILDAIRKRIYRGHDVLKTVSEPWCESVDEFWTFNKQVKARW